MRAALLCREEISRELKKALEREGVQVFELASPGDLKEIQADIVVVQFPLGDYSRGDIFVNLEALWDRSSPLTLIIKPEKERVRRRDLKENVVVVDDTLSGEEIARRLMQALESPDYLLSKGLEAYAERNYSLAYEYWLRLARSEKGKTTKVYEYLKIARKEFEDAGLDVGEIDRVLEERLDPFKEGTRLYSEGKLKEALRFLQKIPEDHPEFMRARAIIENIKEELELEDVEEVLEEIEAGAIDEDDIFVPEPGGGEAQLTPKEAFLLSLMDGESSVGKIEKIVPMDREEFLNSMRKLLKLGLIRRKG